MNHLSVFQIISLWFTSGLVVNYFWMTHTYFTPFIKCDVPMWKVYGSGIFGPFAIVSGWLNHRRVMKRHLVNVLKEKF